MKALIVSISDLEGGGARAAHRLHHALKHVNVASSMLVLRKRSDEVDVASPFTSGQRYRFRLKRALVGRAVGLIKAEEPGLRSLALFPSPVVETINESDCDVVNVHWACDEFLSIADISRIRRPVVITMHDMWSFTGAAHYVAGDYWKAGFACSGVNASAQPSILDGWMMRRKAQHFQRCDTFVSPSQWLAECARSSKVLARARVSVVPNALDVTKWKPVVRATARAHWSVPAGKKVVLFGAIGGGSDRRKGADLMLSAISALDRSLYHTMVFGQSGPDASMPSDLVDQWLGPLSSDASLIQAYSAADAFVMSSRMENFPNTCVEAQACGVPVAGFAIGGVPEIVEDGVTGKLAKPFDARDLTGAIEWCAASSNHVREKARERITQRVDETLVGQQYKSIFLEACERWRPMP